jgi:hypothetical protein
MLRNCTSLVLNLIEIAAVNPTYPNVIKTCGMFSPNLRDQRQANLTDSLSNGE